MLETSSLTKSQSKLLFPRFASEWILNGASYFFSSKYYHMTPLNHGWFFTSSAPLAPNLIAGFLFNKLTIIDQPSGVKLIGNFGFSNFIPSNNSYQLFLKNGGRPVSISKMIHPSVHQSTGLPY